MLSANGLPEEEVKDDGIVHAHEMQPKGQQGELEVLRQTKADLLARDRQREAELQKAVLAMSTATSLLFQKMHHEKIMTQQTAQLADDIKGLQLQREDHGDIIKGLKMENTELNRAVGGLQAQVVGLEAQNADLLLRLDTLNLFDETAVVEEQIEKKRRQEAEDKAYALSLAEDDGRNPAIKRPHDDDEERKDGGSRRRLR